MSDSCRETVSDIRAARDQARIERDCLKIELSEARAHIVWQDKIIESLSRSVRVQSELLSKCAEKPG